MDLYFKIQHLVTWERQIFTDYWLFEFFKQQNKLLFITAKSLLFIFAIYLELEVKFRQIESDCFF